MASFSSILSSIGHGLKKFFDISITVAEAAEPFVDVVFPGIGPLFNDVVAQVANAEALAVAAGSQNGTGTQKLALVLQSVETSFNNYAKTNNLPVASAAQIEAAVNAAVAFLNALPAAPAATASVAAAEVHGTVLGQ